MTSEPQSQAHDSGTVMISKFTGDFFSKDGIYEGTFFCHTYRSVRVTSVESHSHVIPF